MRTLDLEAPLLRDPVHDGDVPGPAIVTPSDGARSVPPVDEDVLRRGVAEYVGTFTLIFIGGGAGIISGQDVVAVALANGLAIGIMVTNVGHISGGHFNPSITLGFLATRRITPMLAVAYWVSQLLGAISAAFLLRFLFNEASVRFGATPAVGGISDGRAFVLEAILTMFLVWAVWATAVDERGAFKSIAGLAIGLTITMDVFVGGRVTGAAMNPARALGPELAGNTWHGWWIYWVGPIAGALFASLLYEYLYLRPNRPAVVGTPESGVDEPRPGETAAS
jgi:aquaporin Z